MLAHRSRAFGIGIEDQKVTSSFRFGRFPRSFRGASSKRRPTGVSRRRKKQLGFETLEDRRVMSADTPVAFSVNDSFYDDLVSYSSATTEGVQQILLREIERYLQQTNSSDIQATVPWSELPDSSPAS